MNPATKLPHSAVFVAEQEAALVALAAIVAALSR